MGGFFTPPITDGGDQPLPPKRPGLFNALMKVPGEMLNVFGGAAPKAPTQPMAGPPSAIPIPQPDTQGLTLKHRMEDDPQTRVAPPSTQPEPFAERHPTLSKIIKAASMFAPIGIGAATGGLTGAGYAAGGEAKGMQFQQQEELQRQSLADRMKMEQERLDVEKQRATSEEQATQASLWSAPMEMTGPDGKPILAQVNRVTQQVRPLQGYGPKPMTPSAELQGKTVTVGDKVMQYNPQTQRYDIPVGSAKPPTQNFEEQAYQEWLKTHPNGTRMQFAHQYALDKQPPQRPPQITMIVPTPSGPQVQVATPGQTLPQGAVTPQQFGSASAPTPTMRTAGTRAKMVAEAIPGIINEIDANKDALGPVMGRWNDFMQGKLGDKYPQFAGLRMDLTLAASAVALAHAVGRLPENLREEFDRAINAPQQNPENLKAVLNHVLPWMQRMQEAGELPGYGNQQGGQPQVPSFSDWKKSQGK